MNAIADSYSPPQGPYMNPFTEFAFKRLLGPENRSILIHLLNSILKEFEAPIEHLEYIPTTHLDENPQEHIALYDLYCFTTAGERIVVQLHAIYPDRAEDRSFFFADFPMSRMLPGTLKGGNTARVYIVGLLDYPCPDACFDTPGRVVSLMQLQNIKHRELVSNAISYLHVSLPKFTKELNSCKEPQEVWFYLWKNMGHLDQPEKGAPLLQEQVYKAFLENAALASLSPTEREEYEESLQFLRKRHLIAKEQGKG